VQEVAVAADFHVAGQLERFAAVAVLGEDQNGVYVRGVELAAARLYGFDEVADEAGLHGAWLGQEFRERHAMGLRIGVNEELGEKLYLIVEERFVFTRQVGETAEMIDDGRLEEALDERHKL
jgi:Cys-tRNA synthase (O-phospho-L-seryl-tRNA:Cys-tRNA synthase)